MNLPPRASTPAGAGSPAPAATGSRRPLWLELTADFRCNNRCIGCSAGPTERAMTTEEALGVLREGRRLGARWLWLGGGEPTLREDLPLLVGAARRLGYEQQRLQTNGMRLAYTPYTARLAALGVTQVSFSLKGATAATHDRLTATPGCFALLQRGLAEARAAGLGVEADVLAVASNLAELPELLLRYLEAGVSAFRIWTLHVEMAAPDAPASQRDAAEALAREVPRMTDVASALRRAVALGVPVDAVTALHTPRCVLGPELAAAAHVARDLNLLIANPGGRLFWLEDSPMEGGCFPPRCRPCAFRDRCNGVRAATLARFGDGELCALGPSAPLASGEPGQ